MAWQMGLCALWGLGQIATKVAGQGISPFFHAGLRSLGAAILILAWIGLRRIRIDRSPEIMKPAVFAGVLFAVEFMLLFTGLNYTSAARATLLLYTSPFFVALGMHWRVASERIDANRAIGMLLAFTGVALAFGDRLGSFTARELLGDVMCLGAAAAWGATTLVMKTTPLKRLAPEVNLFYQLGVSAVLLIGASWIVGEAGLFNPSPLVLSLLALQICVIASASYLCWFFLVTHYNAAVLHTFTFLTPVFGMLFSWWLLDEPIGPMLIFALLLIALGIVLVNRARRPAAA
jgi:drug/metabolite transporter (DMT)-like permease